MTGRLSDDWGKSISLLLYPGMGVVVFAAVRRINGTTAALTATALLACLEPMCRYGGSGTAEMAITAFYACSLLCILRRSQQKREVGDTSCCAHCCSAWIAWTKNEGLAHGGGQRADSGDDDRKVRDGRQSRRRESWRSSSRRSICRGYFYSVGIAANG